MWDFISEWLPVIAFLFGAAVAWLISALFDRMKNQDLEAHYKATLKRNQELEIQLREKINIEKELLKSNFELERLRKLLREVSENNPQPKALDIDNVALRKQLFKLTSQKEESKTKAPEKEGKNYISDYQAFLQDLEKSIKKAKKKASEKEKSKSEETDIPEFLKKKAKKPKSKKKESNDKFEFYKKKYNGKKIDFDQLNGVKKEKDLTYLFGITKKIQELLNANDIYSFKDLSKTKIAELRAILSLGGEKYENIDPLNWPIQARLAEKGHWEILDEYKRKMKM